MRLSWDSVSGGNWKSAGSVVLLLVTLRADLLFVVAACGEKRVCVLSFGWASFDITMIPIVEYCVAMATVAILQFSNSISTILHTLNIRYF